MASGDAEGGVVDATRRAPRNFVAGDLRPGTVASLAFPPILCSRTESTTGAFRSRNCCALPAQQENPVRTVHRHLQGDHTDPRPSDISTPSDLVGIAPGLAHALRNLCAIIHKGQGGATHQSREARLNLPPFFVGPASYRGK